MIDFRVPTHMDFAINVIVTFLFSIFAIFICIEFRPLI